MVGRAVGRAVATAIAGWAPVVAPLTLGVAALALGVAALALAPAIAIAENGDPPRRVHGSVAVGGSVLFTGAGDDAFRLDAALSVQPWRRYGVVLAARAIDDTPRSGMVTAGVEYQAAASRPRLVVTLYADAGAEWTAARTAPVVGGGVRTTLVVLGPVAVVLDTGAHLVMTSGDARLVIGSAAMLAIAR